MDTKDTTKTKETMNTKDSKKNTPAPFWEENQIISFSQESTSV